jgi:peptide deformylase
MAEKDVVTYPNQVLAQQAKSVTKIDANTKKLIQQMVAMMHEEKGVGLAANQVGVLQKVFVYDDGEHRGALVNGKIVSATGEQIGLEGCLSVPGLQGEVKRAQEIVVKGTDENGKEVKIKAEGFLARIFQHEMDHLEGHLFVERAEPGSLHYVTDDEDEEDEEEEARE